MKTGTFKKFATTAILTPALLIGTLPASAQSYGRNDNRDQRTQQIQRDAHRIPDNRSFDRDRDRRDFDRDRDRDARGYVAYNAPAPVYYTPAYTANYGYYRHNDGIGPGKGAAIGAVSGAVLGALFGGGKGALIGGAAGAGVGAIAGQAAQDHRYSNYGR